MKGPSGGNPRPARGRSPKPESLGDHLEAALRLRANLLADSQSDVCRLFHGSADGIDGLVIEKLGPVLVVQLHQGSLSVGESDVRELCVEAAQRVGASAIYRKVYPKDRSTTVRDLERLHRDPTPWWGSAVEPEVAVREAGVSYTVRPYDGYATGLYLDHRTGRERIRALASGRCLLNAFAYTCGFTVAAAASGASQTVSVDISRKSLEWGKRNLAANGVALDRHQFFCSDVFDYYRRALRQGRRFNYIVLDPPTFARTRRPTRVFSLANDLGRLVAGAVHLLDSGGIIQLSVNHRGTSTRQLQTLAAEVISGEGRWCELLERPSLPEDFRGDRDYAKSVILRVL